MNPSLFFFELSGEHPTLPAAEALSCAKSECPSSRFIAKGPGYVILDLDAQGADAVGRRVALTHRIGEYLGSCSLEETRSFASSLSLPAGSLAVRVKRVQGCYSQVDAGQLASAIGEELGKGRRIDLTRPEVEVRVLLSDALHFYLSRTEVDRSAFEGRKVAVRPFFSPISLHPRYARALINLTGVREGETLLDPFCGTGGVLIEAASIGVRVLGSDISEEMVRGCAENLDHFGLDYEAICQADIGEIEGLFGKVDAVATDPPYGRATSTHKEPLVDLYARALPAMAGVLSPGRALGMVLPCPCPPEHSELELRETHPQRVHRSLTRHYCIFTRR